MVFPSFWTRRLRRVPHEKVRLQRLVGADRVLIKLGDTRLTQHIFVDQELAGLVFNRARPQWFDSEQSDQDWLAARGVRLRDDLAKRKARRGRHAA